MGELLTKENFSFLIENWNYITGLVTRNPETATILIVILIVTLYFSWKKANETTWSKTKFTSNSGINIEGNENHVTVWK